MGILNRFKRWWFKIFAKFESIEKDFDVSSFAVSEGEINEQQVYGNIVEGNASWNNDSVPSLKLAQGITLKIKNKVLVEFEAEINAGKSNKPNLDKYGRLNLKNRFKTLSNDRSDYLNKQFRHLIKQIKKDIIEDVNNYGRILIKPYVKNGNIYSMYYKLGEYIPIEYNEREELISVMFINTLEKKIMRSTVYYTLIESYKYDESNKTYLINYNAYKSFDKSEFGVKINLKDVPEWSYLQNEIMFQNIDSPLFYELNLPDKKPIWHSAISNLQIADEQYGRVLWEYSGGELAVLADIRFLKPARMKNVDGNNIPTKYELPKNKNRLFWAMQESKELEENKRVLKEWAPKLRDDAFWRGLDEIERIIEFNVSLSYGAISDPNQQAKTATEIVSSKQNTSVIVDLEQELIQEMLDSISKAYNTLTDLYKLAPSGEWELTTAWGDGIKEDWDVVFKRLKSLVDSGDLDSVYLISEEFGISQEEAELMKYSIADKTIKEIEIFERWLEKGIIDIVQFRMMVYNETFEEASAVIEKSIVLDNF